MFPFDDVIMELPIDAVYNSNYQRVWRAIENSFVHNIRLISPLVLRFCTEQGSIIVVLYAKLQTIG